MSLFALKLLKKTDILSKGARGKIAEGHRPLVCIQTTKMPLELYIGPMFAGKSTEILGIIRRNSCIGLKTVCITHSIDKRYSANAQIVSHNKDTADAIATESLTALLGSTQIREADCIIVEEAQFFTDLKAFVIPLVDVLQKHVICVGLDGDSARAPFGQVLDLVPHADVIHKLKALCTRCGDGTPALFTYRMPGAPTTQINVGTADQYEALCREHYLEGEMEKAQFSGDSALRKFAAEFLEPVSATSEELLENCIHLVGMERGHAAFQMLTKK